MTRKTAHFIKRIEETQYTHWSSMEDEAFFFRLIDEANCIIQHEIVFNMRKRMNDHHCYEQKEREQRLHDMHQQMAWQDIKQKYCDNKEFFDQCRLEYALTKAQKEILDAIVKVVEEEIEDMLLGDVH